MGLVFIPNQAVQFVSFGDKDFNERNADCKGDTTEFCQIAHPDYPTQFQIKLTPDTGEELLTNGDFDTDLSGWTEDPAIAWEWNVLDGEPSALGFTDQFIGDISLTQSFTVVSGQAYKIVIDVCSFTNTNDSEGSLYVGAVDSMSNPAGVFTGIGSDSNPITQEGEYTIMFVSGVDDTIDFSIWLSPGVVGDPNNLVSANICSISVMSVTLPTVTLQDCDGNHVADIVDIVYADEYATVTVDWSNYDEGCYKICVFPEQDTGENLFGDLLCITDELGNPIVDQNNNCIQYPI